MGTNVKRLAFICMLASLGLGGAAFARAAAAAYDDLAAGGFVPSAAPALLGPIDELGRNGWRCVPERAAAASRARAADLPASDLP